MPLINFSFSDGGVFLDLYLNCGHKNNAHPFYDYYELKVIIEDTN
jgi:hypothetical protein